MKIEETVVGRALVAATRGLVLGIAADAELTAAFVAKADELGLSHEELAGRCALLSGLGDEVLAEVDAAGSNEPEEPGARAGGATGAGVGAETGRARAGGALTVSALVPPPFDGRLVVEIWNRRLEPAALRLVATSTQVERRDARRALVVAAARMAWAKEPGLSAFSLASRFAERCARPVEPFLDLGNTDGLLGAARLVHGSAPGLNTLLADLEAPQSTARPAHALE